VVRRAFVVALAAVLIACSKTSPSPDVITFPREGGGATQLEVRVADSDEERARGLMEVPKLAEDAGMAFVWVEPTTSQFWMKDTLIPLSIAFVDEGGRIVTIRDMQPCAADPCPLYGSTVAYVLAIEANLGYFDEHDIAVGDRAVLQEG
jgi:uncharacterized membrane protein (UPF0127 family)